MPPAGHNARRGLGTLSQFQLSMELNMRFLFVHAKGLIPNSWRLHDLASLVQTLSYHAWTARVCASLHLSVPVDATFALLLLLGQHKWYLAQDGNKVDQVH